MSGVASVKKDGDALVALLAPDETLDQKSKKVQVGP